MLVWLVVLVLLGEWAVGAIGRYSTRAIPPRQGVRFVSYMRHTINKCELFRTHNRNKRELLAGHMDHRAGRRGRQPGTIMPET